MPRILWLFPLFHSIAVFAQSGASYTALRRVDTIVIDGNLNEASWASAIKTPPFMLYNGNAASASLQTTARIVWDDQFLYVAFDAKDPDVYATFTARDSSTWDQDTFEVFITIPNTAGYIEVDGSPIGTLWDGNFTGVFQGPGGSYNFTNVRLAGRVNGTINNAAAQDVGYTGEVRIPFADIYQGIPNGRPIEGSQLRMNLYRINWNTPVTQGGKGATGSDTYYAWSPVGSTLSFHQPTKFGTVTFTTNTVAAPTWTFTSQTVVNSGVVLSGTGHPGGPFVIATSTNATFDGSSWTPIVTNTFDAVTGQFTFTNQFNSGEGARFFLLRSP